MIRKIMGEVNLYWPELQRKYPAFEKPILVPAMAIRQEAPMYMRRYIDQDRDSHYMFFKCDATKGACDRETAARLFKELFHDKLRLPSSYERDEMLSPMEAARKELLPADNDRNYRNFFEEQMDILQQQEQEADRERKMQDFEREHGFRPDDPDIIDVEVIEPERPQIAGPANRAVAAGGQFAVGQLKPIWYGVDLHIPTGGALGYDGAKGRIGRRDPRGPAGFIGDPRGPRGFVDECGGAKKRPNAVSESAYDDALHAEIAGMFAEYSGGNTTWDQDLDAFMDDHASELLSLRRSQASGLGDFNAARDLGSDDANESEKAKYEDMLKEAVGEPEGEAADESEKAKYEDMLKEAVGDPEGEVNEDVELSQQDRDDIAAMFAGYSGGNTTWDQDIGEFIDDHAEELRALRRSQASGFGDFNAARDMEVTESGNAPDLSKASKKQLLDELQKRVKKGSGLWADLDELKDKYSDFDECEKCGDDSCKDGEKCGLKENKKGEAPDEELNEEIDRIIDDSQADQDAEAPGDEDDEDDEPESSAFDEEYWRDQEDYANPEYDESDDVLGESFIRHSTMLAREVW